MNIAIQYRDRIDTSLILPRVNWRCPSNDRRSRWTGRPIARRGGAV